MLFAISAQATRAAKQLLRILPEDRKLNIEFKKGPETVHRMSVEHVQDRRLPKLSISAHVDINNESLGKAGQDVPYELLFNPKSGANPNTTGYNFIPFGNPRDKLSRDSIREIIDGQVSELLELAFQYMAGIKKDIDNS